MTNVSYYFAFAGNWVDVYIRIFNPTDKDRDVISAFDKGLNYAKK